MLPVVGAQVFIEPGQSLEQVRTWFGALRDAGMKVCRIRIHESHVNNDGKWDFSIYDKAFDIAAENGVKVFATLFPNDSKKSVGGEKFPESDSHFKEIATYVDKTVAHYKSHPALAAWVIQNEPGVGGVLPDNEFTRKQFAKWQKEHPAQASPSGYVTNSYDREKFLLDYESWYLDWLASRIKSIDPDHGFHVNNHQIFHNVAEYDFVRWRGFLTSLGASAHPSWHYGYFTRQMYPLAMAANCNVIRSGAGSLPWWVTELQAGNNIYSGTVPICPTADEVTQWLWTCIGNGARGVIFWSLNPRSATGEPGEWALLGLDHKPSCRYEAAREFISVLDANRAVFASSSKLASPVTVLYNRESLWAEKKMQHGGVRQDEGRSVGAVMKETLGLYQACCENGIVPEFSEIREFDWDAADNAGKVLIIGNQVALPDEYAGKIAAFVRTGGRLIVTGLTSFFGTDNVCKACTDFLYKDVFGGVFKEVKYLGDDFEIALGNPALSLPSTMWTSSLELTTAIPTARKGGEILCAANAYGRGDVVWIPSLVGIGKRRHGDMGLARLIMTQTAPCSIPVRFAAPQKDVLMSTMSCDGGFVTVLVNKNAQAVLLPLRLDGSLTSEVLYSSAGGRMLEGDIANLSPEETLVVKWTK